MKQLPYFAWAAVCKVGRPLMSSALVSPLHTLSKYTSQMILPQSVNKDFFCFRSLLSEESNIVISA